MNFIMCGGEHQKRAHTFSRKVGNYGRVPLGQSPVPPLSWLPSLGMGGGSGLMDVCRGRNPCYEHPQ